jgi:hypothetical protein
MQRPTSSSGSPFEPGRESAEERQFDALLQASIYRFDCPSPERLNAYFWRDTLTAEERSAIEQHLRICPLCADEFAQLAAFVDNAAPEAPAPAADWLRTLKEQVEQLARKTQLVVATLLPPPPPQLAGVALRDTPGADNAQTAPRSRLYSAEDVDVSLMWQPIEPALLQLSIQIFEQSPGTYHSILLAPAESGVEPAVLRPHEVTRTATTQLAPGAYNLVLASGERFVVIPDLQLT